MSKSDTDTHLRFGQGILIQGYKQKDNDLGFLTAKGFADIKTKYQTYDDILYFKNYRNAIFQILPAGNFEINDELHKAEIENEGKEQTPNIAILKARAKSQEAQFNLAIESKKNTVITFGTSVIFKHIDSESYISGTIRPSSGSNGAFTVEVSNNLSESLIFKLMPYRSFEFLGMEIPFDSPIILKNEFNNGFLTFEKLGLSDGKGEKGMYIEKKPIDSGNSYRIPVKTKSEASSIYQCVTHFVDLSIQKQVPMPWKFVLQFKQVQNDSLIQHDIVYLQHTENQGVLSMDKGDIVLKEMKQPPESPGLKFYQCLWEIEKHDSTDDAYILRHLMSGQTLGIEYDTLKDRNGMEVRDPETGNLLPDESCPLKPILIDISQGEKGQSFGVVELKLAKKQGGQINSDSHINVAWGSFILEIDDTEAEERIGTQEQLHEEIIERRRMAHLLKQEIEYKTRKLVFTQNNAQQHCFVIQEIDNDLKKDVLFALSFHSVIINLREDLKWGAIQAAKKIDYFRMMKVTQKIFQIKQFLKSCTHEQAELQYIFPIQKRQMICKDLGISQLLFELLFYMKMNIKEEIFSDKHNERDKFMELYNTIYEVIRELIRKNRLFKMHISKWIMFVFEDVINSNEPSHLRMLKQLLEENDFFVTNFVSDKLLHYLTDNMLQRMHDSPVFEEKKYLQIFRLFCITGTRVNTANQITIYKTFITSINQEKGSVLLFQLKLKGDQILIKAAIDKNKVEELTFNEFYSRCKSDNESAWDYFVEYLNLIADMTQGRNKVTERELAKDFSLELLTCIFENEELYEAQVPILRILHYLYAQSEDFYPIERQKKIVNYTVLQKDLQPSIISTPSLSKPWDPPFDRVLRKLLQKISACGPIDPSPEHFKHNKTVFELLNFVWETLNLGFWREKDEVKNILESVKKILQKHDPSMEDYEQVKKKSAENSLMIKCKLQCLKIIELIADYDRDLFVQRLSISFKDFQIPQKKRGLNSEQMGSLLSLKADDIISSSFMNTIPDQNQMQPLIQTNIVDQMIELANYDNPQLTSMALSIIESVLQTKKKAIQHFSSQRFVCSDDILRLVEYIDSVRNQFFILEDPNLTKINFDSQYDNYFLVYEKGNTNNMMTTLYNLSQLMKNENDISNMSRMKTLQSSLCYSYLAADKLLNFTMQRSSTSQIKQYIVYCSNLHPKVLSYIFNCKELPEEQLALKLLHLCYKFIVALIQNFNEIKVIMVKEIPKMLHHIKKNVGCVDFLKEMYDNNKNMLYNESQVFELIKFMCDTIEEESNSSYYKSKLLDFFRYLIYCNGRSLKFIQIQILKIMQDDTYKNIMLSNEDLEKLPELVKEYERQNLNKKPGELIEMSPELTYMMTFFQISSSLIDDNNTVNMGKIIKKFPFDKLIKFVYESGTCWPLKRNIRTLLNRLYYFQPQIQTNLKKIIQTDFVNAISDLNSYIKIKHLPDVRQRQSMVFESPVRFSYMESYLYLNLEQNFFTIFQLVTREACIKDMVQAFNCNQEHAYNFIRIAQRLAWVKIFFTQNKNVYSNSMLKFILMKVKEILRQLNAEIFRTDDEDRKEDVIKALLSAEGIQKFYQEGSKKVEELEPLIFQIPPHRSDIKEDKVGDRQRLKAKLRLILKREKRDFYSEDQRVTYFMNKLINSLKLSSTVTEFFFAEFKQKVTTYTSSQHIYNYLTTIIDMNSNNPEALPTNLKVFFLELITFIVEESNHTLEEEEEKGEQGEEKSEEAEPKNEEKLDQPPKDEEEKPLINEDDKPTAEQGAEGGEENVPVQEKNTGRIPIDEWDPEFWEANEQQIVATQNRLKKCNLSKFIVDLLKQDITEDIRFANSILLCAISYLLGGNNLTQKSIIQELNQDEQNKVFRNIQALIQKLGKLILKNITENAKEQQSLQNNFCPTTIDNYDYFDANQRYCLRKNVFEPNSTDEYLYHRLCIATYRRAFKFLQLLCENNNIEGKHFIREQPDKQRQINFINVATRELRSLFQVMCGEIINVPIFLLDFILEVTQIPIKENQQVLMRSTFFEDLCQMEAFFAVEGQLAERGIKEEDIEQLEEIYFKSVEIILSNFQGNDQRTFMSLDKKLSSKFLTNILSRKLATKSITNRQQLIDHIKSYCNEEQEDGRKKTTFSDEVMECLNVTIIFAKMRSALEQKSDIIKTYQRFKKDKRQEFEKDLQNRLREEHGNPELQAYINALQQGKNGYRCMYEYLQKCILKIEITDNNNQEQTVYFPKYPVFSSLSPNLRDYVMSEVERSTHRDKIVSLLGFVSGIKEKIEYSYNLQKKQKITQNNMTDAYKLASFFSVIICFYMMCFYDIVVEYEKAEFTSSYHTGLVKFGISLVQLGFSFMYAYYWYKLKIWYKPQRQSRGENTAPVQEEEMEEETEPGFVDRIKLKIYGVVGKVWEPIKTSVLAVLAKFNITFDSEEEQSEQKFYQTGEFYRIAIFIACSVIGTFFYPITFFIHLIDIFCKIEVLANIFQAVAVNIKSLIYVSFMGVVFVFVFCTVTFSNYMKNVYAQGEGVDEMCDDVMDCVMSLYVSGAISETMEEFEIGRFTYDMIYGTFFGLLFGNIVQGIMLDAFAGLREKNQQLTNDKTNKCYICNMPRQMMEKKGQEFSDHTLNKHFLWNYVFYIIALERKNSNDYTGLEYEISQKYNLPDEEMDVSWIPSKGESEFSIVDEATKLIENVNQNNVVLEENLKTLDQRIAQFNSIADEYAA